MNKKNLSLFFISFFIFATTSLAADDLKFSELRAFITTNNFATEPTELNNLSAVNNVEKLKPLTGLGLEADAKYKAFKVGTRIKGIWNGAYPPNPPSPATSYVNISQYSASVLGRYPIIDGDSFLLDVFGELGLANTTLHVESETQGKGTFKKESGFLQRAGVSMGAGWPSFKFYIEGGYEWNKVDNLKFEGTYGGNMTSFDMTGPYFGLGIIISGIPSWIKPGGVTFGK